MIEVPDTTLAWLAALIDGEGSVLLTYHHKDNHLRCRASISISNTDYRLMEALMNKTGTGVVYVHTRQARENHKKTSYTWRLNSTQLKVWLPLVIPWLILKKEQANLLLEYLITAESKKAIKGQPHDSTPNARKWEIAEEIRALNKKGREHNV